MSRHAYRQFVPVREPGKIPDRVLRAIAAPTFDHRGPVFASLALKVIELLETVFKTTGLAVINPSYGTGESALDNAPRLGERTRSVEAARLGTAMQRCHPMAVGISARQPSEPGRWSATTSEKE